VDEIDPSTLSDALSELIAFDSKGRAIWPAKHLEMMLAEPLGKFGIECDSAPETRSARELLEHPNPSLALLIAIKDLAKRRSKDLLPPEMALLLYYGSIAAAMVRCGQRISKLRDEDLRNGFTWAIKQPWVAENICELFRQASAKLIPQQNWRE
jgi:hypothetical protein